MRLSKMPLMTTGKAVAIALMPVLVLGLGVVGLGLLNRMLGLSDSAAGLKPPHSMFGYSAQDVAAYWQAFPPKIVSGLRVTLLIDLVFPLLYGGAMAYAVIRLQPLTNAAATMCVFIALVMIADWIENGIHLHQLAGFRAGESLNAALINVASIATRCKLAGITLAFIAIFLLAIAAARRPLFPTPASPSRAAPIANDRAEAEPGPFVT